MPITVQCSECEQSLTLQREIEAGSFHCPRCGAKVYLGDREEIEQQEQEEAEEAEDRLRRKKKKRRARNRNRIDNLGRVSLGLGFHFAGILVFMVALWIYWLAFAIMMATMMTGGMADHHALDFMRSMLVVAMSVSALATLIEIPCGFLCVLIPDGASRGWAWGVLACRFCMVGCMAWFALADFDRTPAILNALLFVTAFFLWMCFLRRVADYLGQKELSRETVRVIIQAVCSLVAMLIFLFCISLVIRLMNVVEAPFARVFILSGFAGPLATFVAAWYRISGDSILRVVLYPTGITFLLMYLQLISSMRLVLLRRA